MNSNDRLHHGRVVAFYPQWTNTWVFLATEELSVFIAPSSLFEQLMASGSIFYMGKRLTHGS